LAQLVRRKTPGKSWKLWQEQGSTIVEMSIALSLFATVLLGVVQTCMLLYTYHFVSDAAREASRWAMVRGANCPVNVNAGYCSPTDGVATGADNNDIQAYVNGLGFPFARNLTTATTWLTSSGTAPITWSSCAGAPCNTPGSQVQVTVSYNFPFSVPFWKSTGVSISSTSSMVIAQ
jgi:Flp pilus assembly protein TadG